MYYFIDILLMCDSWGAECGIESRLFELVSPGTFANLSPMVKDKERSLRSRVLKKASNGSNSVEYNVSTNTASHRCIAIARNRGKNGG